VHQFWGYDRVHTQATAAGINLGTQSIVAPKSNRGHTHAAFGHNSSLLVVPSRLDVPTLVSSDTVLCIRRNTVAIEQATYE
jgi:hypothetical protein